jgi:2-polyprenyl-6-methoxyphenol hydroxylase-like FAD-dependent oxidoreductase
MLTTYGCLLGIAPMQPGLGKNDMTFVCNKGYTFQFLTQPDAIYFMIHHKLPEPVRWPNKLRYTDKDAEEMAAKFADHPISDTVRGHLISLEEGVLEHFFFGRTVVIGDAAHKVGSGSILQPPRG